MKNKIIIILLVSLSIVSCSHEKRHADLNGIDLEISIERFDSAFWTIDTANIANSFAQLNRQYPNITPIYLEHVLRFGHSDSASTHETYLKFRNDTNVIHLYSDALSIYKNVDDIEQSLTTAFQRAKFFFPNLATPQIYTHVSGLNQSIVVGEGFLSLSIDNYLGEDYPLYETINIYNYQRCNMRREKISSDYLAAWLSSEFTPNNIGSQNLLNDIIYRGKILYTISVLLPETPEHIIMGYTPEQWEWAKANESRMWGTLMENKHLFATDIITKGRYTNDGPFTLPFTQDSPSRGGVFIGWQIVENWMKKNSNITLMQLMLEQDAQKILAGSNYRP